MVQTPVKTLPHLKWDVARYHEASRLGLLGNLKLELLDGDIILVPPPDPFHEWLIRQIIKLLASELGDVVLVEKTCPVSLSATSEPVPDIAVLKLQDHDYKHQHPQPSDIYLLIEIANSTPERDTKVKRSLYAQAGITEYWVFDVSCQALKVYRNIQIHHGVTDYQVDADWSEDAIALCAFPHIKLDAQKLKGLMNQ
ncbi:MAG: Uma2 family endonuclease [Cyanobacteria bacterium P01_C01_bin.118]